MEAASRVSPFEGTNDHSHKSSTLEMVCFFLQAHVQPSSDLPGGYFFDLFVTKTGTRTMKSKWRGLKLSRQPVVLDDLMSTNLLMRAVKRFCTIVLLAVSNNSGAVDEHWHSLMCFLRFRGLSVTGIHVMSHMGIGSSTRSFIRKLKRDYHEANESCR